MHIEIINIGRIQILQLMYMSNIQTKQLDEAIKLFPSLLIDTNLYLKYRHLNKFHYLHNNWLESLTMRYKKEEWIEFRMWLQTVIRIEVWQLKLPSFYIKNYKLLEV